METNPLIAFFQIPLDRPELPPTERNMYRISTVFLLYTPLMLVFSVLGSILIYFIASVGLLDVPDPMLLVVAGISLVFSLLHLPLFPYAKRGNTEMVFVGLLTTSILSGIAQACVWSGPGVILFPLSLIVLPAFTFLYLRNIRRQYRIIGFIAGCLAAFVVLYLDGVIPQWYVRMDFSTLSQIAGFTVYLLVIATLLALSVISGIVSFRSITVRLFATFAFVAILSAVTTLFISSLAGFFQDRQLAINQLQMISGFKQAQIKDRLSELESHTSLILEDQTTIQGIDFLLNTPPSDTELYRLNYDLVLSHLQTLQTNNKDFLEILILDDKGKVILSTVEKNKNQNFGQSHFFSQALKGQMVSVEKNFPEAAEELSLLIVKFILGQGKNIGTLVTRSNLEEIEKVAALQSNTNDNIKTYLVLTVAGEEIPLAAQDKAPAVHLDAIKDAVAKNGNNWGTYTNPAGHAAFVYYALIKEINLSLIIEIEQSKVAQSAINLLFTNILIGLFTAGLAFTIIYITSQSISNPIISLAQKANALSAGQMDTRITIDREDEIGGLSSSFNKMAEQLQNLVRTLEEKVEDRTQGLQVQANRLLLAAEIARDAATLGNLDDLLARSSQLVLDRFKFYHTGIFLLDQPRDYAILRASPTEAGRTMLEQGYRLRVGKEGIVGSVALTGEARVVADTTTDTTFLSNPLLPKTRSELVIPLKVETRVIGVLDVQSETPQAFSQDDIAILQIMADQLALAIERVQLVKQLESRLGELEHAYQQFTVTSWQELSQQPEFKAGYSFDGVKLSPIASFPIWSQDALKRGRSIVLPGKTNDSKDSLLAVPLRLRGQIIGVLNIRFTGDSVNAETVSLSEEIANRLAVALENARLYTETQKLAQQERAVSEISTRITTSINIENILRTAVQELGRMMPNAEITVRLQEEKEE